jgi:hypothetical protein
VTKSTHNQHHYTEAFIQAAGLDVDTVAKSNYWVDWWWNHTNINQLRLSKLGITFIKKNTKIPVHECVLPEPLRNQTLLQLSRLMTCPYYIHKLDHILLLGDEEAVMLKLHADNLQQYLDNLQL